MTPEHYGGEGDHEDHDDVNVNVNVVSSSEDGSGDELEVPESFICPLTLDIMEDPLMDRRGMNFERKAIVEWLNRGNTTCPLTREPLSYSKLIPNASLRAKIERWRRDHGMALPAKKDGSREFLCMIEAPPSSMMEVRWAHHIISSIQVEPHPHHSRRTRRRLRRRHSLGAVSTGFSPSTRRRRLVTMLDSALSAVRRGPHETTSTTASPTTTAASSSS